MEEKSSNKIYGIFAVMSNKVLRLTYAIPLNFQGIVLGQVCELAMRIAGKGAVHIYSGVLLEFCEKPKFTCVDLISIRHEIPAFSKNQLGLASWMSKYYLCPIEYCVQLLAPAFIWKIKNKEQVLFRLNKYFSNSKNSNRRIGIKGEFITEKRTVIHLNSEQLLVYQEMINSKNNKPFLLHGVTGSGKTEVYLEYAKYIINTGKNVLVMVPEIALTPQMGGRFRAVFGSDLAILHSGLNSVDYLIEWFKIQKNTVHIVLGVRSSIFCPLQNLGLIIIDEEHDSSYKSQEFPAYQARDLAVMRAHSENAQCLLGSATPAVESYFNAKNGKYHYLELKSKHSKQNVSIDIFDASSEFELFSKNKQNRLSHLQTKDSKISSRIIDAIKEEKSKNKQSIVLLNKRGYTSFALCRQCRHPLQCPRCSVSTTLHQHGKEELCHYCAFRTPLRRQCPSCGGENFLFMGTGTQNIEEQLTLSIPNLRIARLDRDTMTSLSRLGKLVSDFRDGLYDCLVGTQMLAKGHDFPLVTLVAVLHVEDGLFLPDFRSGERTFQLLTQTIGRTGRGIDPGRVLVQSFVPSHPILQLSCNNSTHLFLERELNLRKLAFLPPFSRQILFEISGKNQNNLIQLMQSLKDLLVAHWEKSTFSPEDICLAGPLAAPIEKLNEQYRWQLAVRFVRSLHPSRLLPLNFFENKSMIEHLRIDVDPISFL